MTTLATQDRFHVSVKSPTLPAMDAAKWVIASGQEVTREVPKMRAEAGGEKIPLPSREEISDVTTQKVYDQDTDGSLFKALAAQRNLCEGTTITVQELDADGNRIPGAQVQYTGCVVKSVARDDVDANGQEPVMLTVVWAVGGIA